MSHRLQGRKTAGAPRAGNPVRSRPVVSPHLPLASPLQAIHPASILCIFVHSFLVLPTSVSGFYNEPQTISNPHLQKKSDWPSLNPMPTSGPINVGKGTGSYYIKMTTKDHSPPLEGRCADLGGSEQGRQPKDWLVWSHEQAEPGLRSRASDSQNRMPFP